MNLNIRYQGTVVINSVFTTGTVISTQSLPSVSGSDYWLALSGRESRYTCLRLMRQRVLCYRQERLLHVDRFFRRRLEVRDVSLTVAPTLRSLC